MFSQDDIDAVLRDAQQAVDDLAQDVGGLKPDSGAGPVASAQPGTAVADRPTQRPAAPFKVGAGVQRILKLKVPLIVRLARRSMKVASIIKMGPGTILEFDRMVDEELDLMINNCKIGAGVAVKVNEHFGIRITKIDTVQERIDSLGSR